MNFYWIYDLPNWLFLIVCVGFFVVFSLLGAFAFRNFFEKLLGLDEDRSNNVVSTFLSVSGLFYGITLGLIAVGTYTNFGVAETAVSLEAGALNGLYRDVGMLSRPEKSEMQDILRDYAQYMVNEAWALQQQGQVPTGTSAIINRLQEKLMAYPLEGTKEKIVYSEILSANNKLSDMRRARVNLVQAGLPAAVWYVVMIGAVVIIILTWLLVINNRKLDMIVNILTSALLGTLIFLVAAMDNPFRGEFSVSSAPFQSLLDGLMKK
jgi:amino acid transporter